MIPFLITLFVISYLAIALEHPLNINKSASALLGAGLLWTVYAVTAPDPALISEELAESVAQTAQIIFFLIGAMAIVEVIDAHNGFEVITSRVNTRSLAGLICLISLVTFFLSAILDNLTTTIVMVSLVRKLLKEHEERLFFAGMIVIAANAGGAWSPIGDVTTTMLWIGGQITALKIIQELFIPAFVSLVIPLTITAWVLRDRQVIAPATPTTNDTRTTLVERNIMFFLGLGVLIAVPAFKTATQLPPFMGVLLGLGLVWLVGDLVHRDKSASDKLPLTLASALSRIDLSSVVFFIGILLSVATLEHSHVLTALADWLDQTIGRLDVIVVLIGLLSAIVDNVPLVAASIGMYSLEQNPPDSFLWEFLAYCAGTGGSILVIGSAAGVAAMGMEKISFYWYLRNISLLALTGYLAGAVIYIFNYGG